MRLRPTETPSLVLMFHAFQRSLLELEPVFSVGWSFPSLLRQSWKLPIFNCRVDGFPEVSESYVLLPLSFEGG